MTELEFAFSALKIRYPALTYRVNLDLTLSARKGAEYPWIFLGGQDIVRWMPGQFTSHVTNLLELDNNEGRSFLATINKKDVQDEGYELGSAFSSCFIFNYNTQAAQRLGKWFAEHSGYADMSSGFAFIQGFAQGMVDGDTGGKVQITQHSGGQKKENV